MKKFLLLSIIMFSVLSCDKDYPQDHQVQGEALGTTYSIRYFSENDFDFKSALDSIYEAVNTSMSTYRTSSDISKINRGDSSIQVDKNFIKVFEASKKIYKESEGFFDPTVGVYVNAYGFGPGKRMEHLDTATIDSLSRLVGFNKVRLKSGHTISKAYPGIYLDFNAIAKGYTIDVIGVYLESKGVENYLIELGGELRGEGKNLESGNPWTVGIDDPMQEEGTRELKATLHLKNVAMATSGNYRKFRLDSLTGQRFVHTINPLTGKAEKSNLLSASVLAENCMLADGYATAFMALGLERSKNMLSRIEGVEVYFIYSTEEGEINTFISPGFESLLLN